MSQTSNYSVIGSTKRMNIVAYTPLPSGTKLKRNYFKFSLNLTVSAHMVDKMFLMTDFISEPLRFLAQKPNFLKH